MKHSAKWFRCIQNSPVLTNGKLYLCEYGEYNSITLTTDEGVKLTQYLDKNGEAPPYLKPVENQPE